MFGADLDLLLGHRELQVIGTYRDPAQRHKRQVSADEALLDGGELRLVVLDVDVDVLKLPILSPSRSTSMLPCHWRCSNGRPQRVARAGTRSPGLRGRRGFLGYAAHSVCSVVCGVSDFGGGSYEVPV
jgi:hypothetical protein